MTGDQADPSNGLDRIDPTIRALLFEVMAENIADAICLYDADERVLAWNETYTRFFPEIVPVLRRGVPFVDTVARLFAIQHPSHATPQLMRPFLDMALERHRTVRGPFSYQRADDGRWLELRMFPMPNGGRFKMWRDVTREKVELVEPSRLNEALSTLDVGLMVFDSDQRLIFLNSRFFSELVAAHVVRPPEIGLTGGRGAVLAMVRPALREGHDLDKLLAQPNDAVLSEPVLIETVDDRWIRLQETSSSTGIVSAWVDVTGDMARRRELAETSAALAETNLRLSALAATDSLTGLANRRAFLTQLDHEFARARRYGGPLTVLMIDLDHFKDINDRHGHAAGDRALVAVARLLSDRLRATDFIGRIGGEEFAILAPETRLPDATGLAERLREAIAGLAIGLDDGTTITLTTSIGVTAHVGDDDGGDRLLARADRALYTAKAGGRNRVAEA